MRKYRLMTAALTAALALGLTAPAMGNHVTVGWKGQDWGISHNASATVLPDGSIELTRNTGASDAILHVNRVAPLSTVNPGESAINDNGTPWIMYTYEDNGAHRGVDIFIDSEGPPPNPRLQAGSLFTCQGLGYLRYSDPGPVAVETFGFAEGCDTDGSAFPIGDFRAAGQVHTIYVGQRTDGTIDYNYDGTWYSSEFLKGHGAPFTWRDVSLRLRGNSGATAKFIDFQSGANHPSTKNDCKKGGFTPPFKNQGACVSLFASAK